MAYLRSVSLYNNKKQKNLGNNQTKTFQEHTPTPSKEDAQPTVQSVPIVKRIQLMCQEAKKQMIENKPLYIGCGTAWIILVCIVVAVGLCVWYAKKSSSMDNDMFYFSARDLYNK